MRITLPFNDIEKYPLTQRFGERFLYGGKMCEHKGIDYAMPKFTRIIAPFNGEITRITPDRTTGYGKAIYIKARESEDKRIAAIMAHLEDISVRVGYKVKRGDFLGFSGNSGFWRGVNGYHVHFGISVSGKYVDPMPLLKKEYEQRQNLFNMDDSDIKSFLGTHMVRDGESLWTIAQKYYQNGGHFMEIFKANEDIIKNMNLIYSGQIIRIPALKNLGI